VAVGRAGGPLELPPMFVEPMFLNPLGLAEKRVAPGEQQRWRPTADLSQSGANGTVEVQVSTVQYVSFQTLCEFFDALPRSAHAFLVDFRSAYRHLQMAPSELHKLVYQFEEKYYVDFCLVFGAAAGPALFDQVGDLFVWVVKQRWRAMGGDPVFFARLLDDNLGVALSGPEECDRLRQLFLQTAEDLGLEVALDKSTVQASRQFRFLGIDWDLDAGTAAIPQDKWDRLQAKIAAALEERRLSVSDFQSLVGLLSWCARLTPHGRSFLQSLYKQLRGVCTAQRARTLQRIILSKSALADLAWWAETARLAAQMTFPISFFTPKPVEIEVFTDASSTGYGCFWESNSYAHGLWPAQVALASAGSSTVFIEMCAIHIALVLWGPSWRGKSVLIHCDNLGVVQGWAKRRSRTDRVHAVIRLIVQSLIVCGVKSLDIVWIPTASNVIADHLSRLQAEDSIPSAFPATPAASMARSVLPASAMASYVTLS
jgi:hypothetical protein